MFSAAGPIQETNTVIFLSVLLAHTCLHALGKSCNLWVFCAGLRGAFYS